MEINELFMQQKNYVKTFSELHDIPAEEVEKYYPFIGINGSQNSILNSPEFKEFFVNYFTFFAERFATQLDHNEPNLSIIRLNNGGEFAAYNINCNFSVRSTNLSSCESLNGIATGYFLTQMILSRMSYDPLGSRAEEAMKLHYDNGQLMYSFQKEYRVILHRLLD